MHAPELSPQRFGRTGRLEQRRDVPELLAELVPTLIRAAETAAAAVRHKDCERVGEQPGQLRTVSTR